MPVDMVRRKLREKRRRVEARAYVDAIRRITPCAHCGKPMAEWHNPEHIAEPDRRVARLVAHGLPQERIDAEIARCIPLCRRCHMVEDGRLFAHYPKLRGEQHVGAKLTAKQVRAIRERQAAGEPTRVLAAEFNIGRSHVRQIVRGEIWRETTA